MNFEFTFINSSLKSFSPVPIKFCPTVHLEICLRLNCQMRRSDLNHDVIFLIREENYIIIMFHGSFNSLNYKALFIEFFNNFHQKSMRVKGLLGLFVNLLLLTTSFHS